MFSFFSFFSMARKNVSAKRRWVSGFALVGALLFTAGTASAQDVDDFYDYGDAGDELVVTASRAQDAADTVPAQVTVITAEDIAESGAVSVVNVLEKVAGVRFSGGMAGPGSEAVSMRGFGENSFGRVLVLVDGNRINDPDMKAANWNAIPLADIERIEILDGSASVQYGNNAVGGVINIITKKGGGRRTMIELSGGSFFYNKESISHFEPLSWGDFSLTAEHTGTKGYRERQGAQTTNLTGRSDIFLGDKAQLSLNASFSDLYFQLPGGLTKEQFKDDPTQALYDDYSTYPTPNYVFNGDDENTERHFGGGLGFQWFPSESVELNLPLSYKGKLIKSDMASYFSPTYTDRTVHSGEARPQGSVVFKFSDMSLRLLGGVDVSFALLNSDKFSDPDYKTKSGSFEISEWTIGPYLTAKFSPLANLSLSAGVRFDTAIVKAENMNHSADGDKTFTAFVYDGGIVFSPLTDLKLYAKYASLFRYPFVDELAQVAGLSDKFNNDLEPEKGFNAEAGVSYRFGKILDLSANFFFMRLEDEIAWIDYPTSANENLDKTQRLGTNVSFSFTPIELISLDASYAFVNAVFIDGTNKDKHIPAVPGHKIYGSLSLNLPFGLSFGPDMEYVSARYYGGDTANEADTMDAYFLLGARVRYVLDRDKERFALQITARNLLDTRYAAYGTTYFNTLPPAWEYTLYPADGRSINVSLQYRF